MRRYDGASKQKKRVIALTIGALSLSALGAMLAGAALGRPPALDAQMCLADQGPPATVAMLIDASDVLGETQTRSLMALVEAEKRQLPRHGRLIVLLMNDQTPYEPRELLALCNPGSARDANWLFRTPERAERRWREAFGAPLEAALRRAIAAPAGESSPIMQSITGATWRPDFQADVPNRRLVLASDLLQHTPGDFSVYDGGGLARHLEGSVTARRSQAALNGAPVVVWLLHRPGEIDLQGPELVDLWRGWLAERGASAVDVQS